MAHPILHIELSANNRAESAAFYAQIFGFTTQDYPEMNYTMVMTGDGSPSIGLNPVSDTNPAGRVVPHFRTDDVAATLAKINSAGGKTLMESTPIPTVGDVGMFLDPTGNLLALWKPASE